ncbi:DDE superfamily endonuclease containing protein [Histomonas meleagridis]|uniref:DDE superfamily endonuclease containing protein n=1 Tax=Histomonas meleagridis TaxID=135588 RepID=UPI00355988D4|nr:DDE superfamily endonuclease containing protein [Histomonas meleagridis]KAH0805958.1 DDE superfamily endonuclease containing protein [Histomonas meleagridis]
MDILTESELPRGSLTRIQEATGIPKSTLSFWHQKRNENKDWFPNCDRHPNRRVFSKETEMRLAEKIIQQVDSGFGLATLSLKMKAFYELSLSGNPKYERFCASTTFISDFMKRNKLSYEKPHAERRTNINNENVQIFQDI